MKRTLIASLAVLALWGLGQQSARAQFILGQAPPRVRPTVSPAINMGAGGAFSYYGYIKPQMDSTRSILNLQQTLNRLNPDGSLQGQLNGAQLQQQQQQNNGLGGLQTGNPATFFNYSHYFPMGVPGSGGSFGGPANYGAITTGLGGFGPNAGFGNTGFGLGTSGYQPFYGGTFGQGFRR
ncbi:MAG: hypothetical protein HYX68_14560 [Planctomycetes bacterium]|nr:hypothetical protein [Planctomycetota bacterium]